MTTRLGSPVRRVLTDPPVEAATIITEHPVDDLLRRYPPRRPVDSWPQMYFSREQVLELLLQSRYRSAVYETEYVRRRGLRWVLSWLETFPGESWQSRWLVSGADAAGWEWIKLVERWLKPDAAVSANDHFALLSGVNALIYSEVVRPTYRWILGQRGPTKLLKRVKAVIDPAGFRRLHEVASGLEGVHDKRLQEALNRVAWIVIHKGGGVMDVTLGDLLELNEAARARNRLRVRHLNLTYQLLLGAGVLPDGLPPNIRPLISRGQTSVEDMVDRYDLACRPVRDLLVSYLKERQPSVDYVTLDRTSHDLVKLFWKDLELHNPGIASLRLPPEVAVSWKQRLKVLRAKDGTAKGERKNYPGVLLQVRAFYLDIAQWAAEEPERWAHWVAPCPVKANECAVRKAKLHRKSRMDQRTRDQLPTLPSLVDALNQYRRRCEELLQAARTTAPGQPFTCHGEPWTRPQMPYNHTPKIYATDGGGHRHDLSTREDRAFWAWALVEVLRHSGARIEETLELTHHAFVQYTLPTTGEIVPLLQIVPSKTDTERLILVSPELGEVLATVIRRIRTDRTAVPLVSARDIHEKTWTAPMPFLFQRQYASERRVISPACARDLIKKVAEEAGFAVSVGGEPITFTPHDFRRMFVTDLVMNGLPPHIAQVICGHQDINTTMGYKAVYPQEAISNFRGFLARRRSARPGAEYRTPTPEEWDEFLGHFERRKVSTGSCARAFGTPCIHEHACVRCSMLRPDPAQRPRMTEIRDNLISRIEEAEREGWLGEVDGLKISLAGAEDKLHEMKRLEQRFPTIHLGMPDFGRVTATTVTPAQTGTGPPRCE